jgi:hypothetical protein
LFHKKKKQFFPHVVSCDEIASRKNPAPGEIPKVDNSNFCEKKQMEIWENLFVLVYYISLNCTNLCDAFSFENPK